MTDIDGVTAFELFSWLLAAAVGIPFLVALMLGKKPEEKPAPPPPFFPALPAPLNPIEVQALAYATSIGQTVMFEQIGPAGLPIVSKAIPTGGGHGMIVPVQSGTYLGYGGGSSFKSV